MWCSTVPIVSIPCGEVEGMETRGVHANHGNEGYGISMPYHGNEGYRTMETRGGHDVGSHCFHAIPTICSVLIFERSSCPLMNNVFFSWSHCIQWFSWPACWYLACAPPASFFLVWEPAKVLISSLKKSSSVTWWHGQVVWFVYFQQDTHAEPGEQNATVGGSGLISFLGKSVITMLECRRNGQ